MSARAATTVLFLAACAGQDAADLAATRDASQGEPRQAVPAAPEAAGGSTPSDFGARSRAVLVGPQGARLGRVEAWQGTDGVLLLLRADGLPPGAHGLHLHAVGDCAEGGRASGGHVADGRPHGLLHPGGAHPGDLPNVYAHGDGHAHAELFTQRVRLGELRDADGAALIVYRDRDDHQTAPIGGAGERIACAAFKPGGA